MIIRSLGFLALAVGTAAAQSVPTPNYGSITLNSDPSTGAQAVRKSYLDARINLALPSLPVCGLYGGTGMPGIAQGLTVSLGLTCGAGSVSVAYGTTPGTAAQGNDLRIVGAMQKAANLSDVVSPSAARTSLGLAIVAASGAYSDLSGAPTLGGAAALNVGTTTGTVADGGVVAAHGASIAANTAAIATRAPASDPTFTGTVTIPSGAVISGFAPLASPTFTGTPVVPGYVTTSGAASTYIPQSQRGVAGGVATLSSSSVLNAAPPPSQRPPSAMDDVTAGYKQGDLWLLNGRVWLAQQVSAGKAVWLAGATGRGRALDFGVPNPVGAYGTTLLRTGYSGSAFTLTRGSDGATQAVGFIGGVVDAATADAFCSSGGDMAAGSCYVTTLNDHSTAGNDCVQSSLANAPLWTTNLVNGLRAVTFNSTQSGTPVARFCTVAATMIPNNISVSAISQTRSSRMTSVLFDVGPGNAAAFAKGNAALSSMGLAVNAGLASGVLGQTGPAVTIMSQFAGSVAVYEGNATGSFVSGVSSTPVTGGTIGSSTVGTFGPAVMDLVGIVVHSAHLQAIDVQNLRSALAVASEVAPQVRDVWVADGDSITNGYGASFLRGYPRQGLELLNLPVQQFNNAVFGQTLADRLAGFSTYFPSGIYSASAPHFIVSVSSCTDDIGTSGTTGAACYANLQSYVGRLKALGGNVQVVVSTLLPRNALTGSQQTELDSFNTLVRNGWGGFADALADFAADPTMGAASAPSNAALYLDGLHPTDLGSSYIASIVAAQVNALLAK